MTVSLADLAGVSVADWWIVFRDLPPDCIKSPLWRLLKPGFQHVEAWRCDQGVWIRVEPCLEIVDVELHDAPPWERINLALSPTFVRVQRLVRHQKVREPIFFGPWTCVEITKALLGIRAPFARTPWQLFKRLKKEKCCLFSSGL